MYYIFFINNIELGEFTYSAEEIKNFLLGQNFWAFSINAPNIKYFDEGHQALVYLAGKGNRVFAADFIISGKPYEAKKNTNDPAWLNMFPIRVKIQAM